MPDANGNKTISEQIIALVPFFSAEALSWLKAWALQRQAEAAMHNAGMTPEAIATLKAFFTDTALAADKNVIDTLAVIPLPEPK